MIKLIIAIVLILWGILGLSKGEPALVINTTNTHLNLPNWIPLVVGVLILIL